jgi:hypothetical protein
LYPTQSIPLRISDTRTKGTAKGIRVSARNFLISEAKLSNIGAMLMLISSNIPIPISIPFHPFHSFAIARMKRIPKRRVVQIRQI